MICVFCATEGMEMRYDRKGRPFLACTQCGTKAFTRGVQTIAQYAAVADALRLVDLSALRIAAQSRIDDYIARVKKNSEVENVAVRSPVRSGS